MSNILKSNRKESSFQIYIDWLKLRQRLTEYVSSDFNDSKISYNEPNSLKYPNYLYFLFDHERKQLLNLIDKIQDNITHANSIFPTDLAEYNYRRYLQSLAIGDVNNLIQELEYVSRNYNVKADKYINLIPLFKSFLTKLKGWRASTKRYLSILPKDQQKLVESELTLLNNEVGHNL